MSEKDEDYRRQELALQERHSRELAKKSQESAEDMMMARPGEGEGVKPPQGGSGSDAAEPGARDRKSSKVRGCRSGRRLVGSAARAVLKSPNQRASALVVFGGKKVFTNMMGERLPLGGASTGEALIGRVYLRSKYNPLFGEVLSFRHELVEL